MPTAAVVQTKKTKPLFAPGHRACAGCGQAVAAKIVAETLGTNAIIANATGCLEVTTSPYPESSWSVPWIHSLFENAPAVASGILAALKYKKTVPLSHSPEPIPGSPEESGRGETKVVAQGGDGSTFDIGFGLLSGMWERGEDILYICYDNEAYSNTGMQASGATPWGSSTTTTPAGSGPAIDAIGSHQRKKDMIAIALAHGLAYVAQTTTGYLADIGAKIKKAMAAKGPAYVQILVPCVPGWRIGPEEAVRMGKLAAQTGLYPLLEYTDGQLTAKMKLPQPAPRVEEYLKPQGRFAHLFRSEESKKQIAYIQKLADANVKRYGL